MLLDKAFREWGALTVGLVWSFNAYHFAILRMEWLNLVAMQWIPLFILCVFRLEKSKTRRDIALNGGLAVLVFLLSLFTDYYYSLFLIVFFWSVLGLENGNRSFFDGLSGTGLTPI